MATDGLPRCPLWIACAAALLSASACCLSRISGTEDGGFDAGQDAGLDAGSDGGRDAGYDAGEDAGPDAGPDAGQDAGEDAGQDGGNEDAGPDAGEDAGADAGPLGAPDAGFGTCGPGSRLTSTASYESPASLRPMASADMNGDGVLDLIQSDQDSVVVRFGLPDGGLGARKSYAIANLSVVVGDANGDGRPDVVGWEYGGLVTVYFNDGNGGLVAGPSAQAASLPYGVALGDLNGDGRGDLVVGDADPVRSIVQLQVFLAEPDGGFEAPVALTQAFSGYDFQAGLAVADLNGDGLADIVANTPDEAHLIVLLSLADGGFEARTYDPAATGRILLLPNGTATPDLLAGQGEGPSGLGSLFGFSVFHNRGDGTFDEGQTYSVVGGALAIGDFNGDCVPDVATTASNSFGCQPGWGTSVLYGDGDGGFGRMQFLPGGGQPDGPAVLGAVAQRNLIVVGDTCDDGGLTVYGGTSDP